MFINPEISTWSAQACSMCAKAEPCRLTEVAPPSTRDSASLARPSASVSNTGLPSSPAQTKSSAAHTTYDHIQQRSVTFQRLAAKQWMLLTPGSDQALTGDGGEEEGCCFWLLWRLHRPTALLDRIQVHLHASAQVAELVTHRYSNCQASPCTSTLLNRFCKADVESQGILRSTPGCATASAAGETAS